MGQKQSAQQVPEGSPPALVAVNALSEGGDDAGSGSKGWCPVRTKNATGAVSENTSGAADGCPVSPATRQKYRNSKVYNVYSQEVKAKEPKGNSGGALDPKNNMPVNPNQKPAPGQTTPLDTTRVKSTIPKGGTVTTWEYPSPQMFWNAMVRKNKSEGAEPEDMDLVVAIHNNMNEKTWKQVIAWEALHKDQFEHVEGGAPTLLRFTGRPDENSPKAKLKNWVFGCPAPFDRHDWIVDRAGKEIRYIIDYYHDDGGVDKDAKPGLNDNDTVQSIRIDVRPALDSVEAFFDRLARMPLAKQAVIPTIPETQGFSYLPLTAPRAMPGAAVYGPTNPTTQRHVKAQQDANSFLGGGGKKLLGQQSTAQSMPAQLLKIQKQLDQACKGCKTQLEKCGTNQVECNNAYTALVYCMGQIICEKEASAYMKALETNASNEELGQAFEAMSTRIGDFEQKTISMLRK